MTNAIPRLVKLERRLPPVRPSWAAVAAEVDLSRLTRDEAFELYDLVLRAERAPRWHYVPLTDAECARMGALGAKLEGRDR